MLQKWFVLTRTEESGWKPPKLTKEDVVTLQDQLRNILELMKNHSSSWPFHVPVSREEVPDYYDVIKDPIGSSFAFPSNNCRFGVG